MFTHELYSLINPEGSLIDFTTAVLWGLCAVSMLSIALFRRQNSDDREVLLVLTMLTMALYLRELDIHKKIVANSNVTMIRFYRDSATPWSAWATGLILWVAFVLFLLFALKRLPDWYRNYLAGRTLLTITLSMIVLIPLLARLANKEVLHHDLTNALEEVSELCASLVSFLLILGLAGFERQGSPDRLKDCANVRVNTANTSGDHQHVDWQAR